MPTRREPRVEKQKAWRKIEAVVGHLVKPIGYRPDWRTTQGNTLSVQVTFSKGVWRAALKLASAS
jgi:hypothetical protein